MKLILIFVISILTLSANGQIDPVKKALESSVSGVSINSIKSKKNVDTIPVVEYSNSENIGLQPVYYINGKLSSHSILKTIDPQSIDSIHIEKNKIETGNKKYYGQIYITMKKEYAPKLISLTDLAQKYTNLKNGITIFMIDNDIIKEDYNQCLVDEKNILKIIVDTVEAGNEKSNINIVRLLTKSKENIEKSKEIRIRGLEKTTLNK